MMKIHNYMLKFLVSSACLISIGGKSLEPHAMDYNEICEAVKNNYYCLDNLKKEDIEYVKNKGYTIKKFLGSGHSGQVFLATNSEGHKRVLKFTDSDRGLQICPNHYNIGNINELPEKYRQFFEKSCKSFTSPTGDCSLYEKSSQDGIVNLGENACKIYGLEKIRKVNGYDKICVILEYIDGTNLCDYIKTTGYNTSQVKNWLKDICNSLRIMYEKNFLHQSIGVSNIIIRKYDTSAVLIDYERANYKDLIETLRNIRQNKYDQRHSDFDKFMNEDGDKFSIFEPHEKGQYYDLHCLGVLIDDLTKNNKYKTDNPTLHKNIIDLKEADTLDEFLKKVNEL